MAFADATRALRDALSKYLEPMIGYGLWWAWLLCALNSPSLFPSEDLYKSLSEHMVIWSLVSGAVVSLGIMATYRHKGRFAHERPIVMAAALVLTVVSFAIYNIGLLSGQAAQLVAVLLGILAGCGLSTLCIVWGSSFFAKLSPLNACITTAFALLFALIISSLAIEKGLATVIIASLFPIGSAFLLLRDIAFAGPADNEFITDDHAENVKSSAGKKWNGLPLPIDLILIILAFGMAFGTFRSATASSARSGYQEFYVMALLCVVALTLIVVISLLHRSRVILAFTVALPLITLGIFLLSLFGTDDFVVAAAAMKAGVRCVDMMSWVMVAIVAQTSRYSPLCVFGCGRAMGCIGGFFGYEAGSLLSQHPNLILSALIFVLFVLLAVSMFSIVRNSVHSEKDEAKAGQPSKPQSEAAPESPAETAESAAADVDAGGASLPDITSEKVERQPVEWQQAAVDIVAEEYQLTSREKDVLLFLANGRSVGVISEKLVIAKSTVATHVHNIYDKTGVHGRQELIDLLESYRSDS